MAEATKKIVKRKIDDIDSESDEQKRSVLDDDEEDDEDDIGDPWQEMNEENELLEAAEREKRRRDAQNELLGIDINEDNLAWDDETGLVVPIKNLVSFAGRGRDIKERRQSAFGFAHFSTEESSQKQITEFQNDYGIDALLSLLESDDNICRRYSALALGNIVSNRKFATKCIEFGVLEAMLPLAIDDNLDLETRRYCMLAVANMAASKQTHSIILKQGLDSVIILIDSFDCEIQKCSTLCLQNLSSNKEIVMELQDAIQPLVNLISITKGKHIPLPDAKLHSVAALRGLCIADILRLKIINEGVLRAFLQIIDNPPSNAILVEISAILCGFSSLYETHIDLLQPPVLNGIFLLSMGDIVEAQQFGSTTLANLASNSSNHDKLIESNAICNLLIMCDYNDHRVKSSATRALANFASNNKRHQQLLDEGCLEIMIRILNSSDSYNNMFSALFFSILCENNKLHQILSIPEIIQPLFHLIVMTDSAICETIRYSVLGLANLASYGQSHPFILSEIEIQMNSFFSLSSNKDIEIQRYFGLLLSNLAENINSHNLLSTPVALSKIINLLKSNEIEVILNCLSYILKLLSTKKDSIRIRIANMFSVIITNLSSDTKTEELLFMISAYFSNITTSSEVRKQINWNDIVILLGSMLSDDIHKDIQIHAINGLANLRDVNNAVNIMVDDIIGKILKCIQSSHIDIHSSALRLMSGISSHEIAINKLINLNAIHLIGPFVRSPHSAFRKYSYICLANYASHKLGKIDLNDVNLIKCYLNVSLDEKADIEEMRCCLFSLANTSYHIENKSVISESGILIMKTLLDYVQINDQIINEYASLLLANCSVHLPIHSMFGYHDIIQMIINLASSSTNNSNPTTILNTIKCLRNLSFYDEHIHILLECKIIDFIIKFINQRKQKKYHQYSPFIDKQIAALIYNLSSHPSSIKYIARNDLILSITSLLINNQCETRRDAARALTSISMHTDIATPLFIQNGECLDYILSALKFNNDLDLYHSLSIILGYIFSLKQIQNPSNNHNVYKVTRTHILSLLRKQNRQIQLTALWATSNGSENVIMKDPEMLQIIASLAEPQLPSKDTNNDINDTENEINQDDKIRFGESPLLLKIIRRRALITLVNYAKNEENHKLIISNCSNVIGNAFNLNDCNDIDVILLSAMLLSNLSNSLNVRIHELMIKNHDISSLDLYLGYNNENIQIFATRTLSAICNTSKYAKALILSERIIPLLCLTTLRGHLALNQEISSFFQNLTRHKKFIPIILEQHLIPTLIELLKTNIDITIRIRVIKALLNCCCCHETLNRMIEVENGVPFLWNLLLKFVNANNQKLKHKDPSKQQQHEPDENDINNEFISAVIKILSLFTQRKDCKYQFLCGLYHNLNFDDTLSMMMQTKKTKQSDNSKKKEKQSSSPSPPNHLNRKKKSLEMMESEFKSDKYAQNLCKKRLKALLSIIFYAETNEKLLIGKILKELSSLTELHDIWMNEELDKTDTFDSNTNSNKDDEDFYSDISLSYLTIYSSFLIISLNTNNELIEIALTVLSQLLLYDDTASKLLEFDQIQNRFNIINELQIYGNHEWTSIRTLSFNISAYLMEFVQQLIATNSTDTNKATKCFDYLKKYYHHPNAPTITNNKTNQHQQQQHRLNGLSLIKLNAKIPDIRLQAQTARLLAIFSSIKDYVDWLNNDDMYALLFLLAEQSWRIGGDTEIKPNEKKQNEAEDIDKDKSKEAEEEKVSIEAEQVPVITSCHAKDDAFLYTQTKDVDIIHSSVVSCLSNMVMKLKGEFIPESTTLMAAILRYVKDRNPEIRSLAFICIAGRGKRGISPLFQIWDDAVSMLVDTLNSVKQTTNSDQQVIAANVQSNIMKAFILLSENVNHLNYIMNVNHNNDSIFKLLIQSAQSNDSYVRLLALTALKNIISFPEWQNLQNENSKNNNNHIDDKHSEKILLIKMIRYLFKINCNKTNIESLQNYTTQNRYNRCEDIEELLLQITSYIAKIPQYQQGLLIGNKPTIVSSLINDIIINPSTSSYHSFLSGLSLYHLSLNKECFELLINEKVIESSLYIILKYIKSLKHCYVSLSCIANLCVLNHSRVIKGREVHLQTQHEQIINEQKRLTPTNTFPLFALETLHQISFTLNTHHLNQQQQQQQQQQYSLSSVHSLISLIASRITSHRKFELNNMDLCYLNSIIYYFSSSNFYTQTYALITFLNFLSKSTPTMFNKIISSKSWISTLLCLITSSNLSVKNVVLKCILKIIDDEDINDVNVNNYNDIENINTINSNKSKIKKKKSNKKATLRNKLENKPKLLRFLDELFCDSHFPLILELSFNEENHFTLTSISRILLILCENMPITTLLIHRSDTPHNQLLSVLIEFILNADKQIKLNGAASLSCFLSHSYNDTNIPQKILHSAQNGIDTDSNNNRGLIAFYEMITNKEISTFCNNNRYLNANNAESAKPIGATVICALSSLSNNSSFTKQFVNTGDGLAIITNEILNGIANTKNESIAFEAAQILRNICREQQNIKIFLSQNGCQCLLNFISSKCVQLKFLAAGTLADIIYHATSNDFAFTTEHLSPFMTTITDCLLQLLVSDTSSMDGHGILDSKISTDNIINIPTVKSLNNNNNYNTRKLVRICLALLHRLCKDSDNCKKLIVESGAIKPLCQKWFESIKKRYPESDLILSLLKCLATFHSTQIQFIQQNGDHVLNSLVNHHSNDGHNNNGNATKSISNNHNNAAIIISSLCKNIETHQLIATHKIYSLLLTLRHSPDSEARKLGMETLLTFLENNTIHHYVRDDVDLSQTLAAISKFGASKQIKQRSAKIIKTMLGTQAYLDMTRNNNKNDKNNKNPPKFARAKTMKSVIKSPPNLTTKTKQKTQKREQAKSVKMDKSQQNDNDNNNDNDNKTLNPQTITFKKEDETKQQEIEKEEENEKETTTAPIEKTVDFWHDANEDEDEETKPENETIDSH